MVSCFTWFNSNVDISIPVSSIAVKHARPRFIKQASSMQDVADGIAWSMKTGQGFEVPGTPVLIRKLRKMKGRAYLGGQAAIIANHLSRWARCYLSSPFLGKDVVSLFDRPSRISVVRNGVVRLSEFRPDRREKENFIFRFLPGDSIDGITAEQSSRLIVSSEPEGYGPVFEGMDREANFFAGFHHFSRNDWKQFDGFISGFSGWNHCELTTIRNRSMRKSLLKRIDAFDSIGLDEREMEDYFGATTPEEQIQFLSTTQINEIYLHAEGYFMAMVRDRPASMKKAMSRAGMESLKYSGGKAGRLSEEGRKLAKKYGRSIRLDDRWILISSYPVSIGPKHLAGMGDVISSIMVMFGKVIK